MIDKLRELYPAPEWGFYREVRSATGTGPDIRIADGIAVNLWPSKGLELHGFELKVSRSDLRRELRDHDKSRLSAFCTKWWLAVKAPRKIIIPDLSELPRGWGLIELGTGRPVIIVEAEERNAKEPDLDFIRSLLRAGATQGGADAAEIAGAPMSTITRPDLSRSRVGLACGHVATRPLEKKLPRAIPCFSCAEGRPVDVELVEAAIEDAEDEDVRRFAAIVDRQMETRGLRITEEAS